MFDRAYDLFAVRAFTRCPECLCEREQDDIFVRCAGCSFVELVSANNARADVVAGLDDAP